jgi:O-antigen ligase
VLLATPLFVLARVAIEYLGIRRFFSWLLMLTAVPTLAIIAAWGAFVVGGKADVAMALKDWLESKGEWISGVYIGPMPGGEYRVMWIVVMVFPFAILALVSSQIWWVWNSVFILAAVASNTRAVVLGVLLATAAVASVRFRLHWLTVTAVGLLFVAGIIQAAPNTRLVEFSEVLEAGDPRFDQAQSLLIAFESSPLFGIGFGGSAEVVRSESASFSYELTYFALLAKVGLVGMLLIVWWFVLQMRKVMKLPRLTRVIALAAVLCFLGVTSTNPYLLNLFGIWLLVVLLASLEESNIYRVDMTSHSRLRLSSFSRDSTRAARNPGG